MSTEIELLDWDTDFLGYKVGQFRPATADLTTVQRLLTEARAQHIRLLYWAVEQPNELAAATAQAIGALLVDRKIMYSMAVTAAFPAPSDKVETTCQLTPKLYSLALQSGRFSRYRIDPTFAPDVYGRLYARWIENAVHGIRAREVLVYRPAQEAAEAAVMTLGIEHNRVSIGLLAVDTPLRGQSIGTQLLQAARQRTLAWQLNALQVVTQLDNVAACRFYERVGFQPESVHHIYHIWLP